MKICFVVKSIDKKQNYIKAAYEREVEIPFIPTLGMRINCGSSTWLWETRDGCELAPAIKDIVYNFDDGIIYCLFEIYDKLLCNSFWVDISKNIGHSFELSQFETH